MLEDHQLVPATGIPLADGDARLAAWVTGNGDFVRACTCGILIPSTSLMGVHRSWRLHMRHVMATLAGGEA